MSGRGLVSGRLLRRVLVWLEGLPFPEDPACRWLESGLNGRRTRGWASDGRERSCTGLWARRLPSRTLGESFGAIIPCFERPCSDIWDTRGARAEGSYSHTLDLTPLLPYMKALNPPGADSGTPKASYLAADISASLVADPLEAAPSQKTTLLSLLVKAMLLAMEEHPIMRAKVVGGEKELALEIRRDAVIGVAVSGEPSSCIPTPPIFARRCCPAEKTLGRGQRSCQPP